MRANGIVRYRALLDELERMLDASETHEVSLAELAAASGTRVASVYHFFPSKTAALAALAERFIEQIATVLEEPAGGRGHESWEALVVGQGARVRAYYNSHPTASKLLLGPDYSWQIRQIDLEQMPRLARLLHEACVREFVLPPTEDLVERFALALTIIDSIWAVSYARFGSITDDYAREAERAALAYLRGHLPTYALRRRGLSVETSMPD